MRVPSIVLAGLLLHGLAACEESTASPAAAPVAASVQMLDGDGQEALAFSPLPEPLRVRVTDRSGDPVAGVNVSWWASSGTLSVPYSVTDASGIALVYWTFRNPDGTSRLGSHQARATVTGLAPVNFTARSRWGIAIQRVSLTPEVVNVASGAVTVGIEVHATNDIGEVFEGVFRLFSPSLQPVVPYTRFSQASGTGKDGIWRGTFQIPQNAEPGKWIVEITLRSDRQTVFWPTSALESQGLVSHLTVTAGP